jgi:polar amino acid transport system substrate-binding protein
MKRMVYFLAAISMLALSACAHLGGQEGGGAGAPVLARILKRGELWVGTAASMPPLNMKNKKGEIVGFEPDLARLIAAGMGVKLSLKAMPFGDLLPALESEKIDMILSEMTMTPKRNLNVAFAGPYFISGKSFLTKQERLASVKSPDDVNSPDTILAALRGSTSQTFVEKLIPKAKLVLTDHYEEAVRMVLRDQVHALIADYPICLVSVLRFPEEKLFALFPPLTYEPIGVGLPGNDPLLVNWMENFLNTLEGSGELDKVKDRWFEDNSWLEEIQELRL